jgi:maltose alpha-D-glucosyltransferase/alpha-amylase
MATLARPARGEVKAPTLPVDPTWYKDAVIYQLHVRSFFDSNNDGIGDFPGLTAKLDYLQDLGVTALWLLPFYPSPLRDDGYDIADYMDVNPSYGTLRDFRHFVREAHARGLRVITEMVLNHTSDQHPWFQRARRAKPGSADREFYVWSDTPQKYEDARIIFKDFETSNWAWDPVARAYYWHRFYSHQPDLNFDNPKVRQAMFDIVDYWMRMGIDGLRLDAIPYLFEREGTNCENLPETHECLKRLRKHVDDNFPGRMLLAEANQWPEDAIAYFGAGDECHTAFHFPVMPRLFMAIQMENRFPILDILQQTPPIPDSCQWLMFLRNHDELTLEMVTDEERDNMWRVYAIDPQARINLGIRRRLAPLLGNDRRRIELMNGLLFSLAGTPVIYYGDEIGMGDNIYMGDRDGVRTPMQWSPDRNAGFSAANPQQLYSPVIIDAEYLYESINVETLQKNTHSLLWWMKRLIALRQRFPALSRGTFEPLTPDNQRVLAFIRSYDEQRILVAANLSRFTQYAELDLSAYSGRRPIEAFGRTAFPPIGATPYMLTLSPHSFYWFSLEPDGGAGKSTAETPDLPRLNVASHWTEVFKGRLKKSFEAALARELPRRRWFASKSRSIQNVQIAEVVAVEKGKRNEAVTLLFLRVEYIEGEPEFYLLPLGNKWGAAAEQFLAAHPEAAVLQVFNRESGELGLLCDVLDEPSQAGCLFELIAGRRRHKGPRGELIGAVTQEFAELRGDPATPLPASAAKSGHSNSPIVFCDRLFLKVFRRLDRGVNPELETARVLSAEPRFSHVPPLAGSLEYVISRQTSVTLGVMYGNVPNTTTAWHFTLDVLGRYFEHVMALPAENRPVIGGIPHSRLWELSHGELPPLAGELLGSYLESAGLLGRRTGELHVALSTTSNPDFALEPFTAHYQRSLYQSARELTSTSFSALRKKVKSLPDGAAQAAAALLGREREVVDLFRTLLKPRIQAPRIRCHGDYHLGQVLHTGKDFVIIDFEGEPARTIASRRIKRSVLRDVAGMVRSFHYAASQALLHVEQTGMSTPETKATWQHAADFWYAWSSSAFLRTYTAAVASANLLPTDAASLNALFYFHLLERAVYEFRYELDNRPEKVETPLRGLLELLESRP